MPGTPTRRTGADPAPEDTGPWPMSPGRNSALQSAGPTKSGYGAETLRRTPDPPVEYGLYLEYFGHCAYGQEDYVKDEDPEHQKRSVLREKTFICPGCLIFRRHLFSLIFLPHASPFSCLSDTIDCNGRQGYFQVSAAHCRLPAQTRRRDAALFIFDAFGI